jgi:hypothetical protein
MEHISEWHRFDKKAAQTHPKVDAPLQVRYADGAEREGNFKDLFSPQAQIAGWRYVRDVHIK